MGRTGGSSQHHFPPRSGGGSRNGCELVVGKKTGWPVGEMIVVVIGVVDALCV